MSFRHASSNSSSTTTCAFSDRSAPRSYSRDHSAPSRASRRARVVAARGRTTAARRVVRRDPSRRVRVCHAVSSREPPTPPRAGHERVDPETRRVSADDARGDPAAATHARARSTTTMSDNAVWRAVKPYMNGGLSGMGATCVIQPLDSASATRRARRRPGDGTTRDDDDEMMRREKTMENEGRDAARRERDAGKTDGEASDAVGRQSSRFDCSSGRRGDRSGRRRRS